MGSRGREGGILGAARMAEGGNMAARAGENGGVSLLDT